MILILHMGHKLHHYDKYVQRVPLCIVLHNEIAT